MNCELLWSFLQQKGPRLCRESPVRPPGRGQQAAAAICATGSLCVRAVDRVGGTAQGEPWLPPQALKWAGPGGRDPSCSGTHVFRSVQRHSLNSLIPEVSVSPRTSRNPRNQGPFSVLQPPQGRGPSAHPVCPRLPTQVCRPRPSPGPSSTRPSWGHRWTAPWWVRRGGAALQGCTRERAQS